MANKRKGKRRLYRTIKGLRKSRLDRAWLSLWGKNERGEL